MYLYLIRHGEALSKEEDPGRGLSPRGREKLRNIASFVKGRKLSVQHIFHSGKTRALQTAQIISECVQSPSGPAETDGLAPNDAPELWHERIAGMAEDTVLVGHLPHLAVLSSLLLCGDAKTCVLNFNAGSIVCLKGTEDGTWAVEWMLGPGLFQ